MACKQGIRQHIEASKRYREQQRRYDPFRELWESLVHTVYHTDAGYHGLNTAERLYFSVGVLDGEVYNGGMYQFFSNSSGSMFQDVVDGLLDLRTHETLKLLMQAKGILFGNVDPPRDQAERWRAMPEYPDGSSAPRPRWDVELDEVDEHYCKDPDHLGDKLRAFAEKRGLVAPFQKSSGTGATSTGGHGSQIHNSGIAEGQRPVR